MKKRLIRYLSGRTEMAKFDSLMKATFNPPRNWTLLEDLKFYSDILNSAFSINPFTIVEVKTFESTSV